MNKAGCDSCIPGATGAELKLSEKVCGGRFLLHDNNLEHSCEWRSEGVGENSRNQTEI